MRFKNVFLLAILILCSQFIMAAAADLTYVAPEVLNPNEELIYKVKYIFLKVGTLKLSNLGVVDYNGEALTKLKITVDSSPGIPFVNIHDIYESYVDEKLVPRSFYAWEKKGDHTLETEYKFNYADSLAYIYEAKVYEDSTEISKQDTVELSRTNRDVLSLLFFARQQSSEKYENIVIPTFILGGQDSCFFYKTGEVKSISFNDKKIDTYYLKGKVKFIGIAGIKDKFEGWFSSDKQRVPVKAKMKAFFGSISIELEEYRNWLE